MKSISLTFALLLALLVAGPAEATRHARGASFTTGSGPSITTSSPLPTGTVGSPYSETIAATGGTTPYTWSILSCFPCTGGGWSIGSSTGILVNSAPSTAETESIDIQVEDATTLTNSKSFSVTINSSGGGPPAPTNVVLTQGGGTSTVTDEQSLTWDAVSGATSYTVYRNSVALAACTAITALVCNDTTATNSNTLPSTNSAAAFTGPETNYAYYVRATNGSGNSPAAYPKAFIFSGINGGPQNQGAQYSGGGGVNFTANVTSGSNIITVTATPAYPLAPGAPLADYTTGNAIGGGWSSSAPPQTLLAYGTDGTSGTGGAGTYAMAFNATGNSTGDTITWGAGNVSNPGGFSVTNLVENPWDESHPQAGATFDLGAGYSTGGGYMQQFVHPTMSNWWDFNSSAFNYFTVDVYLIQATQTPNFWIYSRPGAGASAPLSYDYNSVYLVNPFTCNGTTCTSAYKAGGAGSVPLNTWTTLKIPLTALGYGAGTVTGCMSNTWVGTGTITPGSSDVTFTLTSTISGTPPTTGQTIYGFNGGPLTLVTSTGTNQWTTNNPNGDWPGGSTSGNFTQSQLFVTASVSGAGIDFGSFLVSTSAGATFPVNVFAGQNTASAGSNNPAGTYDIAYGGTNTTALPTTGLGTPNGSGGCTSTTTFSVEHTTAYKPHWTGGGEGATYIDNYGWSTN
jgi:large repetitive protein